MNKWKFWLTISILKSKRNCKGLTLWNITFTFRREGREDPPKSTSFQVFAKMWPTEREEERPVISLNIFRNVQKFSRLSLSDGKKIDGKLVPQDDYPYNSRASVWFTIFHLEYAKNLFAFQSKNKTFEMVNECWHSCAQLLTDFRIDTKGYILLGYDYGRRCAWGQSNAWTTYEAWAY